MNEEYQNILRAKEKVADLISENAITTACMELEQDCVTGQNIVLNSNGSGVIVNDVDAAYDETAHKLAVDAISHAKTELQTERVQRLQVIAELDWTTLDKRVKETADMKKAELRCTRDIMSTGVGLMQGALPNSISDSVIDARPWRRYVTIDMGDVVRANSDVVNFYIGPRETPISDELHVISTGSDVSTVDSGRIYDQSGSVKTHSGQTDVRHTMVATCNDVMETNQGIKQGKCGKKRGLLHRCRKFLRSLFCCRGQQHEE